MAAEASNAAPWSSFRWSLASHASYARTAQTRANTDDWEKEGRGGEGEGVRQRVQYIDGWVTQGGVRNQRNPDRSDRYLANHHVENGVLEHNGPLVGRHVRESNLPSADKDSIF